MIKDKSNLLNALWRDSSILFFGMIIVHVLNLGFQILMGRVLMPNEYALLASLIGIFNIFLIPLGVVSLSVNRMVSLVAGEQSKAILGGIIFKWLKIVIYFSVLFSIIFLILSPIGLRPSVLAIFKSLQ